MKTRIMLVRDGRHRDGLILDTPEAAFRFLRPKARRLDREHLWRIDLLSHISGDPAPSSEDRETTKRIKAAGDLLGIPLIDHLIVAGKTFYSFRQSGLL